METGTLLALILSVLSAAASLTEYVSRQVEGIQVRVKQEAQFDEDEKGEIFEKVVRCLDEQLPEINGEWAAYVEEASGGRAHLYERMDDYVPVEVYRDHAQTEYLGRYYEVYVGESHEDHSVCWSWFYVSEDYDEVLWNDYLALNDSEYAVLYPDEWRKSERYPKLDVPEP